MFYENKKNLYLLIVAIFLFALNSLNIFYGTPMVPDQHWAQKIFYLHVPSAWVGFLSYFIAMISGFLFLSTKKDKWDITGTACAEIGTLFMSLVLITGPIWATPIWGKPWIWEPRLTTTLILFLTYVGYFMMRSFGGNIERVKKTSAVIAIIAFLNVPIIFFFGSVLVTRTSISSTSGNESTAYWYSHSFFNFFVCFFFHFLSYAELSQIRDLYQ